MIDVYFIMNDLLRSDPRLPIYRFQAADGTDPEELIAVIGRISGRLCLAMRRYCQIVNAEGYMELCLMSDLIRQARVVDVEDN